MCPILGRSRSQAAQYSAARDSQLGVAATVVNRH
jgi:hypothetical protein